MVPFPRFSSSANSWMAKGSNLPRVWMPGVVVGATQKKEMIFFN